ncbi:glycosyltransferase family 4 protein [Prevotella sp. KH2C16]|uniref:glycosyltransferase family 4 protein n=1 Tax=Prevotella sp. KH2C16 TaxID=1855325 RepID=UPI0008EBFB7C|nr:glycosyltransferase family 4 protein [Prevotella sp. KH2C16]SFG08866.1 Glycosyltransferase involved in cell wall bisynthesis [Prevotella sp. KH2C16]
MGVLVYHPTGNQNVRALLRALAGRNILHSYHTTVAVFSNSWYYKYLVGKLKKIKRRTYPDIISGNTHKYPLEEILMFLGVKKLHKHRLTPGYIDYITTQKVVNYLDRHIGEINCVYCYPGFSSTIMKKAKENHIACVYELTTAYYRHVLDIMDKENSRDKKWADTITFYRQPDFNYAEYDLELQFADKIVCASSYIQKTLIDYGFSKAKIKVVPYGFPSIRRKLYHRREAKIHLLYVGSLAQSKGLSYMFDAVDALGKDVALTLIGSLSVHSDFLINKVSKYSYLGNLSHDEVLGEMHRADVVLFPTLSDGFGMVVTEAMSQGTPVIATVNSCACDVIQDGINGWIVPIADSEAIIEVLNNLIKNPSLIEKVGEKALETAAARPWEMYEKEISKLLMEL